jgi:hypothetical protein
VVTSGAVEDRHPVWEQQAVVGEQLEAVPGRAERDRVHRMGVDHRADVRPGQVGLQVHDRLEMRARRQVAIRIVERDADDFLVPHVTERLALALDVDRAPVRAADAGVAEGEILLAEPGDDPAGQRDLRDRVGHGGRRLPAGHCHRAGSRRSVGG